MIRSFNGYLSCRTKYDVEDIRSHILNREIGLQKKDLQKKNTLLVSYWYSHDLMKRSMTNILIRFLSGAVRVEKGDKDGGRKQREGSE